MSQALAVRLGEAERRLKDIEDTKPAVVASKVEDLIDDVRALRRALIQFTLGMVSSAIVFAFTTFALLGQH